jgi:pimeloyl-ACP methyl ester carboxylesterase
MKRALRLILAVVGGLAILIALGFRGDHTAADLEARYATAPSRFVTVDGLRIHYRDRGTGPVVVMLHGASASLFAFEPLALLLQDHFRVITIDLPGHGLTGPDPKRRYTAAGMAEVVDRFAAQLGLDHFTIVGNSMGGGVAWHTALLFPARVDHLVLVDAHGLPREEPRPIGFRLQAGSVTGAIARWVTPRFMVEKSIRQLYGDPRLPTEALIATYDDLMLRDGNRQARREAYSMAEDELHTRLGELKVPTLILWGAGDPWILPKYAERFHAAIAGSELVMLPGLGHCPMEEAPAKVAEPLRQFLASHP